MFPFENIAKALGWAKEEPDLINDEILCVYVELNKTGVSDRDIAALSRRIAASNGVVVDKEFYEDIVEECTNRGIFRIYISEQYASAYVDTLKADSSVKSAAINVYGKPRKRDMKSVFPEVFEGLYYCESCDEPVESEETFCINTSCPLAVQNMREANKELIKAGQMEEILPKWRTKTDGANSFYCHCHEITFTSDLEPDDVNEINCPGCGEWVEVTDKEEVDDEF